MTDQEFKGHFRVTRTQAEEITRLFVDGMRNTRTVSPRYQTMLALGWLANEREVYRQLSLLFGLSM